MGLLEVRDLHASVAGKSVLNGFSLDVGEGEVHAIMGPNGSGKSSLASVLMGSPKFVVSAGQAFFDGVDLLTLAPDERARRGLFLAFQHPTEIHGLKFFSFIKRALEAVRSDRPSVLEVRKSLWSAAQALALPRDFDSRDVNYGLSGGEKKRAEILQLSLLKPKLALLDEIDSGLDVDSVKVAARQVSEWASGSGCSLVLMTHYKRVLDYVAPDFVHVMVSGRIVKTGGFELAEEVESRGYAAFEALAPKSGSAGVEKEEAYTSLLKLKKEKALREAPQPGAALVC